MFKPFTILLALLTTIHCQAQTDTTFHIGNKQNKIWLPVLFTTAGIGAGLALDKPAFHFADHHQTSFFHSATNITNGFGEKTIVIPALFTVFGTSFIIKDERLKTTSWNAIKSVIATSIFTEGIKYSTGRARPFTGEDNLSFHPFSGEDIYKSMPSGHASLAFAIFTPFAETYSRWIYIVPASVAIGRVYQQKHWLSDVMIGGAMGWVSGYMFNHSKKKVVVGPGGLVIWF